MAAYVEDTIAAIATGPSLGAISILRVSGRDTREIAQRILRSGAGAPLQLAPEDSHRARTARLVRSQDGSAIDEVLVVPMMGPRSYSGEDTVEIHCHGGRVIADLALRAALSAGARGARPGEFTERAYLNGRLDLCQAEAVADMISAGGEAALEVARRQLDGDLSAEILSSRDRLLDVRALVEAHLDFPEDDLPAGVEAEFLANVAKAAAILQRLAATYARGRLVRDGVRVVLAGKPNVGKSSLLNALLGRERALVSAEAGTTRDYLEEPLAVGGLQILLCDTAGIRRDADGHVERAGVERSVARLSEADVAVFVVDGSQPLDEADMSLYGRLPDVPRIAVRNKSDLGHAWASPPEELEDLRFLAVSATAGTGLTEFTRALEGALPTGEAPTDGLLVTNARHFEGLERCLVRLAAASDLIRTHQELELVAAELAQACSALDELVGRSDVEDVLDRVFSRFCVGK